MIDVYLVIPSLAKRERRASQASFGNLGFPVDELRDVGCREVAKQSRSVILLINSSIIVVTYNAHARLACDNWGGQGSVYRFRESNHVTVSRLSTGSNLVLGMANFESKLAARFFKEVFRGILVLIDLGQCLSDTINRDRDGISKHVLVP